MNQQTINLTYDEIDKLLESFDEERMEEIKWKFFAEEELDSLLEDRHYYE